MKSTRLGRRRWLAALACLPLAYFASSGPVLATAFWLREATGWDGFYATMYLYYPVLAWGGGLAMTYVEWWTRLFGTVGPG